MKDSTSPSLDVMSVDRELCCQKKCANCFEMGGCIYEQYPVSTLLHVTESKPESQLNSIAPLPKRA